MAILQTKDQDAVRKEFQRINGPVKLVVFSQELVAGELCRQNEQLMKEVAELSDQITIEVLNPQIDKARAEAYGGVSDVPLTVVEGARDYGIRFLGIPAGYEFSNLIDAIVATSRGESALTDETKATLATLPGEVEIKIFSTPT
jgi:alkyl hydroperoxide reductase subunit AhpF